MGKDINIDVSEEVKVVENVDLTLNVEERTSVSLEPMPIDKSALERARELIRMNVRLIKEEKNAIPA